jgi:hypothetical protein
MLISAHQAAPILEEWLQVCAHLSDRDRLACVVTVCGYPVLLTDLVSFVAAGEDRAELALRPPDHWAARARERGEPVNAGRSAIWERWA